MSEATVPLDPALYESRAGVPIAVVVTCLTVAVAAVSLRTYARAVLIRQFGADDWAAIVALVFAMGSGIMVASSALPQLRLVFIGSSLGRELTSFFQTPSTAKAGIWQSWTCRFCQTTSESGARHPSITLQLGLTMILQTFYISIVLYNASLTATKITFLLQYYRILGTGQMRMVIIIAFVLVGLWSISQLLVVVFTCTPIHKFWLSDTPGTCIPNLPFWYINAGGNIVTDVIVFLLPLPALGRLNLRRGQKLGLIAVFCLGFFVSLAPMGLPASTRTSC